ncbi:MAG: tetratricopeptide repeat protein [bacterium]
MRTVLAYNLLKEGRALEAQGWAEEAVELSPRNAEAHYVLGVILMQREKLSRAEEEFTKAANLEPDNAEYVIQLADIMLKQGKARPALLALEDFAKRHPEALMVRYYVAAILRRAGDPDEAAERYENILESSPSFYPALYDLMKLEAKRGNFDKAIEHGYALVGFFPSDADSRKLLSKLLIKTGKEEAALEVLEGGKAVGKPDPAWSIRKGFVLLDLEKIEAARSEFEEALQIDPKNASAVYGLGLVERKAGNETEALSYLEAVPPESKFYLSSRRVIIVSALESGETGRAKEVAKQLYSRHSSNPKVLSLYVWTLRETGDYKKAERLLKRALKKSPDKEDLWLELALTYSKWGKNDQAINIMQDYLEDHPESPAALNFIGYTLAEQGKRLDEAERMVRKALELSPDSGFIMDSLGWVYYQRGEYEKALDWLKKAQEAAGPDPEILLHLGDCYRALGEESKAADSYERAREEAVSPSLLQEIESRLEDIR